MRLNCILKAHTHELESLGLVHVDSASQREGRCRKGELFMPWCLVRRDSVKTVKSQPCPVSYETITAWLFAVPLGVLGMR